MGHRALRFRESAQNSAEPAVHLVRATEWARLGTCCPPCTLLGPGPETDWNVDRCRTGLWTVAWQDFSHPWVVCNSSKTEGKGGDLQGRTATGPLTKIRQNITFYIMLEIQKDLENFSAGIGNFFLNLIHKNFVRNLMSKLARSP